MFLIRKIAGVIFEAPQWKALSYFHVCLSALRISIELAFFHLFPIITDIPMTDAKLHFFGTYLENLGKFPFFVRQL